MKTLKIVTRKTSKYNNMIETYKYKYKMYKYK